MEEVINEQILHTNLFNSFAYLNIVIDNLKMDEAQMGVWMSE